MDFLNDPAAIGAFLRPLFWLAMFGVIAIILKFVPLKVRRFLTFRLF